MGRTWSLERWMRDVGLGTWDVQHMWAFLQVPDIRRWQAGPIVRQGSPSLAKRTVKLPVRSSATHFLKSWVLPDSRLLGA